MLPLASPHEREALVRAEARKELNRRKAEGGVRYFEPQEQQIPVLQCQARGNFVIGGNRCIAADTVVSVDGRSVGEIDGPFECWSWDGGGLVRAQAEAPFVKGWDRLYRLTLSTGETLDATVAHLVLTPGGYQSVGALRLRERPVVVSPRSGSEAKASVEQIELIADHAPYYDFHVPFFNNYLAGGCINHNSGKTVSGGVETAYRLLGKHPYKPVHRPPIKVWVCSQDLPGKVKAKGDGEQETHKQLEELRRWIPKDELRGGEWEKAFSPGELTLSLRNGSLVVFKGYDQGLLKFESDAVHFIWMDEEPDDKRIWSSCLLRLSDFDGQWMITATPVLSLQGKGWIEELWERRAEKGCGYEAHQLFSYDNPHLQRTVLDELFGNLTDEERKVRAEGAFARLGGRVLSEFDPRRHLVEDEIPDRDLRHYLIIDPGWHTAAHLFAAVDRNARILLYGEHYCHEEPILDRMRALHFLWQSFGEPELDVIVDAANFNLTRQGTTEKENPSDVDEYREAAEKIGARWFKPRKCIKADPMAYRVKRYLATDMLKVCKGLRWWRWEQERWVRQREQQGPRAAESAVPDAPIRRYSHLMDCLPAGTLIRTEDGEKPIESITTGDRVLTREGYRSVVTAWETGIRPLWRLETQDGDLIGTGTHRIWSIDRADFVPLSELGLLEKVITLNGERFVVHTEELGRSERVFNFQVEGPHEYYANGILVSNCTRYLVNELPDALPLPKAPEPLSWQKIMREADEKKARLRRLGENF